MGLLYVHYATKCNVALTGNYKEGLNHLKKSASSAKYNLALMLFNGLGDYPDFELARKLFQEAKIAGHTHCDNFYML